MGRALELLLAPGRHFAVAIKCLPTEVGYHDTFLDTNNFQNAVYSIRLTFAILIFTAIDVHHIVVTGSMPYGAFGVEVFLLGDSGANAPADDQEDDHYDDNDQNNGPDFGTVS